MPHSGLPKPALCHMLLSDLSTRWSSTYMSMALLDTSYPRLAAFFEHAELGTGTKKIELTHAELHRMRQPLGVLRSCYEVSTTVLSATRPVCGSLPISRSLWKLVNGN